MDSLLKLFSVILYISLCYSFRVRRDFGCGSPTHYSAPNGTIKSHAGFDLGHHYGKNIHCTWTIEAPQGWKVELVADTFELESTSNCYRDYLQLFDGPTANTTSIGKYCGSSFSPVSSSGRFLTLVFVTNYNTQMAGFKLNFNWTHSLIRSCPGTEFLCSASSAYKCIPRTYICDGDDDCADDTDEHNCPPFSCASGRFPCVKQRTCIQTGWLCDGDKDCADGSDEVSANCHGGAWKCGNLNNTGRTGDVRTPGFPITSYPNSIDCKFHIYAPSGTHAIALKFDPDFHIETDVSCTYDYVTIYADGNAQKHGPFCGDHSPANFQINATHVIVEFNSDNSDNYKGFKVSWTAI